MSRKLIESKRNPQFSSKNDNFVNISKRLLKNRNEAFPLVPYFTLKLEFVSNVLFIIVAYGLGSKLRKYMCEHLH